MPLPPLTLLLALMVASPLRGGELPALPESLAQWYKPVNERQVWLHLMFSLRREMQAVEEYAAAGDETSLRRWTARFAEHYRGIGDKVPEWRDELDEDALRRLETAAASVEAVTEPLRDLQRSCTSCHREYRALAAAKFRTPDFGAVEVGGKPFGEMMETLSRTVNRVQIGITDERWAMSETALELLRQQLSPLRESCGECHREAAPVDRILGRESEQRLERLAGEIAAHRAQEAGRELGGLAVEVCARCHAVHRTLYDLQQRVFR